MLAPKSLQRREFHLSFTETGPTVEAEAKAAKELAAKEEKPNPDAAGADGTIQRDRSSHYNHRCLAGFGVYCSSIGSPDPTRASP